MRKLLLLFIVFIICFQSNAQRYADMSATLTSPPNGFIAYWNKAFRIEATIRNMGVDTLRADDTLGLELSFDGNLISFGSAMTPYIALYGVEMAPGDTNVFQFTFGVGEGWDTGLTEMCVALRHIGSPVDTLIDTVAANSRSCSKFTILSGVSVAGVESKISSVKLYPNPANGVVNFDITTKVPEDITVSITDMAGRIVTQVQEPVSVGLSKIVRINTSALSPGMYFYTISTDGEQRKGKLQVQ